MRLFAAAVADEALARPLRGRLQAYVTARNATDPSARRALLDEAVAPGVEVANA